MYISPERPVHVQMTLLTPTVANAETPHPSHPTPVLPQGHAGACPSCRAPQATHRPAQTLAFPSQPSLRWRNQTRQQPTSALGKLKMLKLDFVTRTAFRSSLLIFLNLGAGSPNKHPAETLLADIADARSTSTRSERASSRPLIPSKTQKKNSTLKGSFTARAAISCQPAIFFIRAGLLQVTTLLGFYICIC